MPYYNKKEYPKQIWVSQIPEREVSLLRENLAGIKQTNACINKKRGSILSAVREAEQRYHFSIFESVSFRPCQRCGRPGDCLSEDGTDTFLHADMVVEGFEEVDMIFLQRVYERHFNIPWTILETKRCIVRELELSDMDDLFSMYAEPGMTDYMEGLYEYEEELEYQKAYIENMYRFYGYGMWLVFEKKTGTLIGRLVWNTGRVKWRYGIWGMRSGHPFNIRVMPMKSVRRSCNMQERSCRYISCTV